MAIANIYKCDKCKSVNQSEEFRLDAKNFHQYTFSCYPVAGGGGPMMPGGPVSNTSRNETFQICSECKAAMDADLDAIINPLKA